ncbi:MAG: cation:proton antiporter [Planctomycetes bacterium]|nr:cation:proton antiporter [Planctomycetota bacterium]
MSARARILVGYTLMLVVASGGYLLIREQGQGLVPSGDAAPLTAPVGTSASNSLAHVLLALAAITLAARGCGALFQRWLGQPPVIGEIVAGLALGPSLLGAIAPTVQQWILPAEAAPFLGMIAKVGVVLFMFLVGLDVDLRTLRRSSHATLVISHASIVVPFLGGAALSLVLYPLYATADVGFTVFSLFLGVAMSVTAFPVLARILSDRRVQRTRIGTMALACAAVDDATAWTLLAFVAGVATAKTAGVLWVVVAVVGFAVAMFTLMGPLLRRLADQEERRETPLSHAMLAAVFVALLVCGAITEFIGIHALFGSFLFGVVMRHEGRLADQVRARTEDLVVVLLLPAFFAYTGMRTEIGLLHSGGDWLAALAVIAVATIGKFGGSYAAGRLVGLGGREASAIGVLLNTRGLMELVVLNVGLEMRIISPTVFAMFVAMALVTTFATAPLLRLVMGRRGFASDPIAPADGLRT